MPPAKQPITSPAAKYGPTKLYGPCELGGCRANARSTCAECAGDFCLAHAEHRTHADT